MVGFMSFVASRHVNICSCFCFSNADIALAADAFGRLAACVVFVACAITVVHCAHSVGAAVAPPGVEGGRVFIHARRKTWTPPARVRPWKAQSNTYLCNFFRGSNGK